MLKTHNKQSFLFAVTVLLFFWLISQLIYVKLGLGGDQELYLSGGRLSNEIHLLNRTEFTSLIYSSMTSFGIGIISTLIPPLILLFLLRNCLFKVYTWQTKKYLFLIAFLLPHFWIWQSIASKEAIFMLPAMFLSLKMPFFIRKKPSKFEFVLIACSFCLCFLIRPHYSLAYLIAFAPIISIIIFRSFTYGIIKRHSYGLQFLSVSLIVLLGVFVTWLTTGDLLGNMLSVVMNTSSDMFLSYDATSNRLDIPWNNLNDFFGNAYWGIPFSLIGFTPAEVLSRPLVFPIFIEGLIFTALLFRLFFILLNLSLNHRYIRFVFFYGFLPALVLAMFIHYPFGIFNPGSAIRYKQSLAPLFFFFPLSIIAVTNIEFSAMYRTTD